MLTTITKTSIPIGELGVLPLQLPKIVFKGTQSGKRVVILACQHANEITPLFVLRKLISFLTTAELAGTVTILPVANPLGLIFDSRREPLDGGDLNRLAPGNSDKDLGKRLASVVWKEVEQSDFVIDLHTFSRQCGVVGVLVKSDDIAEQEARKVLKVIAPDCIWQIDMDRKEDARFAGALDIAATAKGIPAITIEMERHLTIQEQVIDRVVTGLQRALCSLGSIQFQENILIQEIPVYHGTYIYFDASGIFIPQCKPFDRIEKGTVLGNVVSLNTFEEHKVCSPIAGELLTIRFRDFVRTGTKLGSVGIQIETL